MPEQSDLREYLVLSRGHWDATASKEEVQAAIDAFYAWYEQSLAAGLMKPGHRLAKEGKVVSKRSVTDGPFAETKEVVGGYWFIIARSLEEAVALAAQNPALGQVVQQDVSMRKFFKMLLRSQGIDPDALKPDPGEMGMDPTLMQGQAGNPQPGGQNPAMAPDVGQAQGTMAPPNPQGMRGIQQP